MDETYIKVNGRWAYLYRAVDQRGHTIDFYLSSRRNTQSAYRFLAKIFNNVAKWQIPHVINTDKAPTYGPALSRLKREGKCPENLEHRQIKYKNNVIESDHGKLKRIIKPMLGFRSMKTAYATIVDQCALPLTGKGVVNRIITDLGVLDITADGVKLVELAKEVSFEDIQKVTGVKLLQ